MKQKINNKFQAMFFLRHYEFRSDLPTLLKGRLSQQRNPSLCENKIVWDIYTTALENLQLFTTQINWGILCFHLFPFIFLIRQYIKCIFVFSFTVRVLFFSLVSSLARLNSCHPKEFLDMEGFIGRLPISIDITWPKMAPWCCPSLQEWQKANALW